MTAHDTNEGAPRPMGEPRVTEDRVRKQPSAASLVTEALGHVSALIRKEVDLARAEMSENLKKAGVAIGLLVGAAIVALVALHVLAAALVVAVGELLGEYAEWAPLIVGVVLALIAFAMVAKALNDLKASSLAPTRTAKNIKRDQAAVKEAI